MRILHSKATTDPILLVSACHNMNLFAVVTSTTITVYRSTTLTVVATLSLCTGYVNQVIASSEELRQVQETMNRKAICGEAHGGSFSPAMPTLADGKYKSNVVPFITDGMAAWSPSGRLFTFALLCGVVLLVDVESSDLVRVFVPKPRQRPTEAERSIENTASSSHAFCHGHRDVEERNRSTLTEASRAANPATCLFGGFAQAEAEKGRERYEKGNPARDMHSHAPPTTSPTASDPAVISISTAVGPVAALGWTTVPYSQRSPRDPSFCTAGLYAECLPLQPGLSSSLLAEVETSWEQKRDPTTADGDAKHAVAILMILDMTGGLSFIVGGLKEVHFITICISYPPGNVICVEKLITVPVQETQPRWTQLSTDLREEGEGEGEMEAHSTARPARVAGDSFFFGLTSHSLRSLTKQLEQYRGKNPTEKAYETLKKWVQRTVRHSHRMYLVVKPTNAQDSNYDSSAARRELLEIDLGFQLTRIVDTRTATICGMAEYCRIAHVCLQDQQQIWRGVLEKGSRLHLRLPSKAVLLRDAVVERIARPNPADLMAYYASIDPFVLVEDLEKLGKTLRCVVKAVEQICYRGYDAAISLLSTFGDCNAAIGGSLQNEGLHANEEGRPPTQRLSMRELSAELIGVVGELRRCAETFLRCVQLGVSYERDLLQYVLHRSSLLLAPSTAASTREGEGNFSTAAIANAKGSAASMNVSTEPLAVEKHPTLLRTLERIHRGRSTVLPEHPTAGEVAEDCEKWGRRLERLIRCALNLTCGEEDDGRNRDRARTAEDRVDANRIDGIIYDRACGARFVDLCEPHVTGSTGADSNEGSDLYANEEKVPLVGSPHLTAKVVEVPGLSLERKPLQTTTCGELHSGYLSTDNHSSIRQTCLFHFCGSAVSLQTPPTSSPQVSSNSLVPVWYGYLREDRHLFVYLPVSACGEIHHNSPKSIERESASDVLVVAFNDDTGNILINETEEVEEEEGEKGREGSLVREWGVEESGENKPEVSNTLIEVSGMPISASSIRATMSRAREFFVVAANSRFIVFDLYDD